MTAVQEPTFAVPSGYTGPTSGALHQFDRDKLGGVLQHRVVDPAQSNLGAWGDAFNFGNEYAYVGNEPLANSDHWGLFTSKWHRIITQSALNGSGLTAQQIDIIVTANGGQDNGAWRNGGPFALPQNHGDNNDIAGAVLGMINRWQRIQGILSKKCITEQELDEVLREFGRYLHTLQDL